METTTTTLDEYQKAINNTTLNYSTQIDRATKGTKLPKNIKADKRLNQIKYVLESKPHKLAGYISKTYNIEFGKALDIAGQYKLASENVYRTLQKALKDTSDNIAITTSELNMSDVTGAVDGAVKQEVKNANKDNVEKLESVDEIKKSLKHVDESVTTETPYTDKTNKRKAIAELRRTSFTDVEIKNNKQKYAQIFQREEKQKTKLVAEVEKVHEERFNN